jgi:hypothetical protein
VVVGFERLLLVHENENMREKAGKESGKESES